MVAQKGQKEILTVCVVEGLTLQAVGLGGKLSKIGLFKAHIAFLADALHGLFHTGGGRIQHGAAALLEDARLGGGDLLQGAAQKFRVIQADIGQHCHLRHGDHIGGIQRAAHANLQHHDVALLPQEIFKADAADQFKLRGMVLHGRSQGFYEFRNFCQVLVGDVLSVDLDALVEFIDTGGGKHAHPVARLLQNGGGHGSGAAFAVGAGNVDELQFVVGVAHPLQKFKGSLQTGLTAQPGNRVDIFYSFNSGHFSFLKSVYFASARRPPVG